MAFDAQLNLAALAVWLPDLCPLQIAFVLKTSLELAFCCHQHSSAKCQPVPLDHPLSMQRHS
jgi:hypothetical protein